MVSNRGSLGQKGLPEQGVGGGEGGTGPLGPPGSDTEL